MRRRDSRAADYGKSSRRGEAMQMQGIVETTEANLEAARSAAPALAGLSWGRRGLARPDSATSVLAELARILGGSVESASASGGLRSTRSAVLAQAAERIGRLAGAERASIRVADASGASAGDVVDWRRSDAGAVSGWRRIGAHRELVCTGATGVVGTIALDGVGADERSPALDPDALSTAAALVASYLERDAISRSLAARTREQACLERSALVGRVARDSAHDLNNVLTAVVGYLDLLDEELGENASTAARESLEEIRLAATRGASIVDDVLDFSRGRGRVRSSERADLAAAIRRIEAMLRRVAGRRIALALAVGEGPFEAVVDVEQLERVLANLVANARHAIEARGRGGSGRIGIALERVADGGREPEGRASLHLVVRDDGCGMNAEVKRRAGERDFTTRTDHGGNGLGLAAAVDFAAACGGRLEIESEPGMGSAISLVLPAAPAA